MSVLKRILAVGVVAVSALVLLLSLASIAGTWVARPRLRAGLVGIVMAAETRAEAVQQQVERLDNALLQAHGEVLALEQEAQALGANLEEGTPLLNALLDRLDLELSPLVDRAREIVTAIHETADAVNSIVEGINALPFVTRPVPELEALDRLSEDLQDLEAEVQALRTALKERQAEIVRGAIALITTPTSQLGAKLAEMQTAVSDYGLQIRRVQLRLSTLRAGIGRWLTWAAIVLTLALIWVAFSQAGLLVLGWRAFLGQDLLPRKGGELPTV